ncbi:MAG: galactitol-1-phosphate 5-dehydrogenase [Coriobacteriia bacterium]|nr:galactitol-1-phosphate 5-dehydrogenase [Coriobacteriia bacterium]
MKACVLEDIGKLVYKEVETPVAGEGEVLLKIRACGICSSDIDRVLKTGTYHFPTIPGHEFAGEIVAVGAGVDSGYIGKRAAVFPLLPCKVCPSCRDERYVHCFDYSYFGSRCDGAFAEYLAVPLWNTVIFPDSLSFDEAALCEPTAVALHAVAKAKVDSESTVVVIGSGTIGIIIALRAKQLGAKEVVVVGTSERKMEFVRSLGISKAINAKAEDVVDGVREITSQRGADIVFECVGSDSSLETSLSVTKKMGHIIVVGNPHGDMSIERNAYWKILRNELTLTGVWNSSYNSQTNDWKDALEFIARDDVDLAKLITHRFSLEQHKAAFDAITDRNEFTVKVMFINE